MDQHGIQNAGNAAEWCLVPPVEPGLIPGLGVVYRLPQEAQYWGGASSEECLILAEQYSRPYKHTEAGPDPTSPELPAEHHIISLKTVMIFHTLAIWNNLLQ
jgi:hypothetical protein